MSNNIENEFHKRFSNQNLSNDDFDKDGLWDAITEDLDAEQSKPVNNVFTNKWMLGMLVFCIIGLVVGMVCLKPDSSFNVVQKKPSKVSDDLVIGKYIDNNNVAKNKISVVLDSKEGDNLNVSTADAMLKESSIIETKKENLGNREITNNYNNTIANVKREEGFLVSRKNISNTNTTRSIITKPKSDFEKSTIASIEEDRLIEEELSKIPSTFALLPSIQSSLPTLNKGWKAPKDRAVQWQIGIVGGGNINRFNYQSNDNNDLVNLKKVIESKGYGVSYGIDVGALLKNKWLINSGIEYHQLLSKFDYEEKKAIQVLKENQVLKAWIDINTNDTLSQVIGDATVNAISTRKVLHYNKYQRISIPIEIGIQKNTGKFLYGITTGAVLNFTQNQSGKTLDSNSEIVSFEKDDATVPFDAFQIGLRVRPMIGYQLSDHLGITFQPQWMWHRKSNFDGTDVKINFHQFNLNLGVGYSF